MKYIYDNDQPYQTLVYPDKTIKGVRGLDRIDLLKPILQKINPCSVLDICCNTAMDGILGLVGQYISSYTGIDADKQSTDLGREISTAWKVNANVINTDILKLKKFPRANVLFLFSTTRKVMARAIDIVKSVQPTIIFVENHGSGDFETDNMMKRLNKLKFKFNHIGDIQRIAGTWERPRTIWQGSL